MGVTRKELEAFTAWAARRIEADPAPSLGALAAEWQSEGASDSPVPVTLADRLRAAGVLGAVNSGIGDLSTNPKHMEGFGS